MGKEIIFHLCFFVLRGPLAWIVRGELCISRSHWQIFILSPSLPVQSREVPGPIPMLFGPPQELLVTSIEIPC